jgi:hypothetical protein
LAALPLAQYSLDRLYLFPYYQDRETYEKATGQPCPAWNPDRRPKRWLDPAAADSEEEFIVYERVLATDSKDGAKAPLAGPDGKPYFKALILLKDVAATVNIPPFIANVPGADQPPYQPPCRALEANEELFFHHLGMGQVVMVKNTDLYVDQTGSSFTAEDRALLRAIAAKLGVR